MNKYLIVFCAILFAGCTDEDSSHRALMMEGYGVVTVLVVDNMDGSERRMVLGQSGYTEKI